VRRARIAILISGRGSNMEAVLRASRTGILRDRCEVVVVVSDRADAPGLERAVALDTPVAVVPPGADRREFDGRLRDLLEPLAIDYVVLAGFRRILSPVMLERYRDRIVNIHPADTRRYQGLHGYAWAFASRLPETKVTVHLVDEGVDTGRILGQRTVDLRAARTLEDVERAGLTVEHEFYSEVLAELFSRPA
jgi:phosphoribosylglycinamide formyltransferase 1